MQVFRTYLGSLGCTRRDVFTEAGTHQQRVSNGAIALQAASKTQEDDSNDDGNVRIPCVTDRIEFYRAQLDAIYARRNPKKRHQVDEFLAKYSGKEILLYQKVCQKYDLDPARIYTDPKAWPSEGETSEEEEYDGDVGLKRALVFAEDAVQAAGSVGVFKMDPEGDGSWPEAAQSDSVEKPSVDPCHKQNSTAALEIPTEAVVMCVTAPGQGAENEWANQSRPLDATNLNQNPNQQIARSSAGNRARRRVTSMVEGKWMLVVEKGPRNVVFYAFDTEEGARASMASSWYVRILFRWRHLENRHEEVDAKGKWNVPAVRMIRWTIQQRTLHLVDNMRSHQQGSVRERPHEGDDDLQCPAKKRQRQ